MNNFFKEILLIVLKIALPIIVVFGILYLSFNFNFELNPKVMYFALLAVFFLIIFMVPYINKRIKNNYKNNIVTEDMPYEFRKIYMDLYNNHIITLEKMRKKLRWRTVLQFTAFALFFVGFLFGRAEFVIISPSIDAILPIVGIISFFVGFIFTFINYKYKKTYTSTYKNEIISNFIKLLNDKLIYKPDFNASQQIQRDYIEANFENRNFNRFYQDDYIEGNLDTDISVKMVDVHLQNVTGSGKNRHTEEIFQGIFGLTKCSKDINTYIKISKNKIKLFDNNSRVEMDSQEFEKYFDINTEDRIIAMQILTSDVMAMMIDFAKETKIKYELTIKVNHIYIRFHTGEVFEPRMFKKSLDYDTLKKYYDIIDFVFKVSREMNKVIENTDI